ncbi:glucose 1-dehydrogenase [Futiania mangrovi]|uniref:Glucose 1-dehydrogenase n=1 Tax=Futiania mangrovi TaxID=2959716 RepID=A0A9J6PER1_9PROT|nr:glucose 1-dehydrogenase [Futiania mangrovii]MCP1336267.1 glucose 1-dehydrogenase [Futiania mangrovii]
MDMGLAGKVAIVTGGGRGIGAAICKALAAEGAHIVANDIDRARAEETGAELTAGGAKAIAVAGDITRAEDAEALAKAALDAFGRIDILVNNAGFTRDGRITKMTEDDWDSVVDVILKGTFLCTRAVIPAMTEQKSGRIVNIASRAHWGNPGQANYSAAKAGVVGFTRSQAAEHGRNNITVNAVAPGFVETPLVQALPHYEKIKQRTIDNTPIPRLGRVEDIADAVTFLASERASWITGELLHVTGGRYRG